jgi:hypothetical protein
MTDCFGEMNYRQNTISIQHDGSFLIQSYMKLCMQQFKWLDSRKSTIRKTEFEEAVVNQLTNVMMGVFRDNDWLVDMLKNDLEKRK